MTDCLLSEAKDLLFPLFTCHPSRATHDAEVEFG
jgi:hypothetical protein